MQKLSQKSCYNLDQRVKKLKVTHSTLSKGTMEQWHCAWVFANHVTANYLCFHSVHESLLSIAADLFAIFSFKLSFADWPICFSAFAVT